MDIASQCYAKATNCVTRNVAGETIIVPVRDHVGDLDSVYTLNEVGTLIWDLIDDETSFGQIVEAVCGAFDIGPEEAEKDTAEFLGSLQEAGLIQLAGVNEG